MNYQLSDAGIDLIVEFEGLKLAAYNDTNGWATIGIGHLIRKGPVEPTDQPITKQQAYDLFRRDSAVEVILINRTLTVDITQGQFDAMVSLAYNIGIGRFMRGPIPNLINTSQFASVPAEFLKHDSDVKGNVLPGLVRRRNAEITLFNS